MKKILFFLTFTFLVNNVLNSQGYPVVQQLGSNNTLIRLGTTYGGALKGNLIQGVYADTTEANTGYIDLYPGAIIFSTGNATMYVRNAAADGWIALATGLSAINIYTSDGTLTGNRTLAGVGNSLTFSGLSDFLVEDATGEIKLGTSEFNRLRISSGFTAFISLDADSLLMTRLPQSQLLSTDSVLVRTADFKVKTRAVSSIGSTYTAGNGLTLSGSQFKLGGTLTEPTIITGSGTNLLKLDGYTSANVGYLGIGTDFGYIRFGDGGAFSPTYENEIYGGVSQIGLKTTGDIYLDAGDIYTIGIPTVSSTTGRKVALIDTATGKVERIDPATLVTTPTLQQVLTAGSTLTTNHTIDFGGNDLKIKGDSLQIVNTDGDVRIKLIPSAGGVGSAATRLTFINADAAEMFIQSGDEYLETYSGWYIRNEIGDNPALSVNGKTGGQTAPYIEVLQGAEKLFEIDADSFSINPPLGVLNIDSLRTWSGISDTTYKKPMTWDTRNGRWEYAANWYGGGGGSVSSASGTGVSLVNGSSLIKRLKEGTGITITDNTDSVTVSRVSDSTMVRNLRWKYRNTLDYNEDYEAASFNRWAGSATGAGSIANDNSFTMPNWMLDYFGAVQNATGTTTTGSAISYYGAPSSGAGGTFRNENTKNLSFEVGKVLFPVLSDSTGGTDIYKAAFGLFDWWASDITQAGIQIVYDRASHGNYWAIRSDGGSVSTVVTTTPIEDSTRYTIRLEVSRWDLGNSGGSVRVYINDVEVVASSGTYPITTNIPYGTWQGNPFYLGLYIKKSAGTNSRVMYADWTHIYAETVNR